MKYTPILENVTRVGRAAWGSGADKDLRRPRNLGVRPELQGNEDRIAQEMRDAYPLWRRVDLWAVGWLLLRMKPL